MDEKGAQEAGTVAVRTNTERVVRKPELDTGRQFSWSYSQRYPVKPVYAANVVWSCDLYSPSGSSRYSIPGVEMTPLHGSALVCRSKMATVCCSHAASRASYGVYAGMGLTCAPAHIEVS